MKKKLKPPYPMQYQHWKPEEREMYVVEYEPMIYPVLQAHVTLIDQLLPPIIPEGNIPVVTVSIVDLKWSYTCNSHIALDLAQRGIIRSEGDPFGDERCILVDLEAAARGIFIWSINSHKKMSYDKILDLIRHPGWEDESLLWAIDQFLCKQAELHGHGIVGYRESRVNWDLVDDPNPYSRHIYIWPKNPVGPYFSAKE